MKNKIVAQDINQLKELIKREMELLGNECDLNHIDVSNIKSMVGMFEYSEFNGNISQWNVANVDSMAYMFYKSKFNQDISKWNVSNVQDLSYIFYESNFNQNISKWNVSNVNNMSYMFAYSQFNQDISQWNISIVEYIDKMFKSSMLEKENKLPYWNLPTQQERMNAYLKYHAEQEKKHIEDFLNLSSMIEVNKKRKANKI